MVGLDWEIIKARYSSNSINYTKTGKPFRIRIIPESAMFIDLPSNEQIVRKTNLERVVDLISQRSIIEGMTIDTYFIMSSCVCLGHT